MVYNNIMKTALFGGAFDPVHSEHVALVRAAISSLGLDRVIVMPSLLSPHKENAQTEGRRRLEMCKIAFRGIPEAEVSDFELKQGTTSYSYLTCRAFAERFPDDERFFLVGADMLESFSTWRYPEEILKNVTLVACGRGKELPKELHARFRERFSRDFIELDFSGGDVSSTKLRVALAFRKEVEVPLGGIDGVVLSYIDSNGLYRYPEQEAGLRLEKEERRAHSFRVALYACERARGLMIPERKALLAAMLHDCGKYVSLTSPLLDGMPPLKDVPPPVVHQYAGAYLAERRFGISDGEILDAIRYHTSGRAGMGELEKLIFLSDLLEEDRKFDGVEELRALFWRDLDACLERSLFEQMRYLRTTGKPIYALTEQAYRWIAGERSKN